MTTPVDQYLPEEFRNSIMLPPDSAGDPARLAAAQSELAAATKAIKSYQLRVDTYTRQIRALQNQINTERNKAKPSKSRIASLNKQITALNGSVKSLKARITKNTTLKATTQNRVYELSGQFEKLLEGSNRDAYAALKTLFEGYGLGSLANQIFNFAKQGYGADVISLMLQDTAEYKQRFAANETRRKAGLPVLNPAEYLSVEQAYRQVLQEAGLPKGFYDNPADFTKWISGDVSPTEIKGRAEAAATAAQNYNPFAKAQLKAFYGIDEAMITAYALDQTRALPLLQKQFSTALFGGEATARGLAADRQRFESYVARGLSADEASQGFQALAQDLPNLQAIAARWGETFSQAEGEEDVFGIATTATEHRRRLAMAERGLFSGAGGATPGGLAPYTPQT